MTAEKVYKFKNIDGHCISLNIRRNIDEDRILVIRLKSLEVRALKANIESLVVIKESGYFKLVVLRDDEHPYLHEIISEIPSSELKLKINGRHQSRMMHRLGICDNFINQRFIHSLIIEPMIEQHQHQQQQQNQINNAKSSDNTTNNANRVELLDRAAFVAQICAPFEIVHMSNSQTEACDSSSDIPTRDLHSYEAMASSARSTTSAKQIHLFKSLNPRYDCLSMIMEEIKTFIGS